MRPTGLLVVVRRCRRFRLPHLQRVAYLGRVSAAVAMVQRLHAAENLDAAMSLAAKLAGDGDFAALGALARAGLAEVKASLSAEDLATPVADLRDLDPMPTPRFRPSPLTASALTAFDARQLAVALTPDADASQGDCVPPNLVDTRNSVASPRPGPAALVAALAA